MWFNLVKCPGPLTKKKEEIIIHFNPLDIENLIINVNKLTCYNRKKVLGIIFKIRDTIPF